MHFICMYGYYLGAVYMSSSMIIVQVLFVIWFVMILVILVAEVRREHSAPQGASEIGKFTKMNQDWNKVLEMHTQQVTC